jgi:hypothetical protein
MKRLLILTTFTAGALVVAVLLTGCATTAAYRQGDMTVACTRPAPDVLVYAGKAAITTSVALLTSLLTWDMVLDDGIAADETQRYTAYAHCKSDLEAAGYERDVYR